MIYSSSCRPPVFLVMSGSYKRIIGAGFHYRLNACNRFHHITAQHLVIIGGNQRIISMRMPVFQHSGSTSSVGEMDSSCD
jgi:hypothetical protein